MRQMSSKSWRRGGGGGGGGASQHCAHSTFCPHFVHSQLVVVVVSELSQPISTSSQHCAHSTLYPHFTHLIVVAIHGFVALTYDFFLWFYCHTTKVSFSGSSDRKGGLCRCWDVLCTFMFQSFWMKSFFGCACCFWMCLLQCWFVSFLKLYQHPLNILPTQHSTHILPTHNLWCLEKIKSYQHPPNSIPTC